MKTEYAEEGSSLRHLDIEIEATVLSQAFDDGVDEMRKRVKLPGFRKGRIPRDLVKTRFHSDVMSQVLQQMVPTVLNDALTARELNPISEPRITNLESVLGGPLKFRASFEVMPEVNIAGYKGIEAEEKHTEVTEEQIEEGLESLRDSQARFDPVENRGIQDKDLAKGNLVETPDDGGEPSVHEGATFEVGSGSYHQSLDEKLQGRHVGDQVSVSASFPVDMEDPKRAGKTFNASFEILEIKEKVLPDVDDELAKDVGDFDTLAELRKHLRNKAEEESKRRDEQELRTQLLTKLIEANPFDPPEVLVEHELDSRIEDVARSLIRQGIDPRNAPVDWQAIRDEQRDSAAQSIKATILLDQITRKEELKEGEEEVEEELKKAAEAAKRSVDALRAQMTKDDTLEQLRRNLRREKAFDFIKAHAKLE